jgi:hypothetical protein
MTSLNILTSKDTDNFASRDLTFIVGPNIYNHQLIPQNISFPRLIVTAFIMKVINALLLTVRLLASSLSALPISVEDGSALAIRWVIVSPATTTAADVIPADPYGQ